MSMKMTIFHQTGKMSISAFDWKTIHIWATSDIGLKILDTHSVSTNIVIASKDKASLQFIAICIQDSVCKFLGVFPKSYSNFLFETKIERESEHWNAWKLVASVTTKLTSYYLSPVNVCQTWRPYLVTVARCVDCMRSPSEVRVWILPATYLILNMTDLREHSWVINFIILIGGKCQAA